MSVCGEVAPHDECLSDDAETMDALLALVGVPTLGSVLHVFVDGLEDSLLQHGDGSQAFGVEPIHEPLEYEAESLQGCGEEPMDEYNEEESLEPSGKQVA